MHARNSVLILTDKFRRIDSRIAEPVNIENKLEFIWIRVFGDNIKNIFAPDSFKFKVMVVICENKSVFI